MSYWQHLGTGEVLAWFLLVKPLSTPLSLHVLWTRSSSQKLDEMCFHFYISLSFLPSLLPAPSAYPWFSAHVEVDKEQGVMPNRAAGESELSDPWSLLYQFPISVLSTRSCILFHLNYFLWTFRMEFFFYSLDLYSLCLWNFEGKPLP